MRIDLGLWQKPRPMTATLVADVLTLLDHHSKPSPLLREASESGSMVEPKAAGLPLPMGRYVLERLIGEGATGRVFAAMQRNPRRPVAVKLLRPGLQSEERVTERFLREAELLAKLDHPAIARVYESGVAMLPWGPQAFIAMELIDGQPLTEFAVRRQLDLTAKLNLLAKVCDAVEYSHAHGVVHRDLKPSNVLVQPDGQPRVLDFGVVHAMYDESGTQPTLGSDLVGTLAYMCPEYAEGKDQGGVHCDVYSLGVMAYELISGFRPVVADGSKLWEAVRAVREHRFPPLRERAPGCGRDLDLVVDKALRADPRERYQSAGAFASDLRRVVESRPVSVRRPTALYRVRSLLRRTPRRSIAGVALVAIVFAGGIVSSRQWFLTQEKLYEMKLLSNYVSMIPKYRPGVMSPGEVAEQLSRVSEKAQAELKRYPSVESDLQSRIAVEYLLTLGRYSEAERALQRAIDLGGKYDLENRFVWDIKLRWAILNSWRGISDTTEQVLRRLIAVQERRGDDPNRLYSARLLLAWQLASGGRSDELAVEIAELEKLASILGPRIAERNAFDFPCMKASALYNSGNAVGAEKLLPPVDEIKRGLVASPWEISYRNAAQVAAFVQVALGRLDVAKDILATLLQALVAEFGPECFEAMDVRSRLAGLMWLRGELADAEREFSAVATLAGPEGLDDSVLRGHALNSRGVCLRDMGRFAEAESVLKEALELRLRAGGPDSMVVAWTRLNLGSLCLRLGRGREALAHAEDAARIQQLRGERIPASEVETRAMIGRAKALIDGPAAGLPDLQRAWQIRWDSGLLTNWQTDVAVDGLVEALLGLGRREEVEVVLNREYARLLEIAGPENSATKRAAERRDKIAHCVEQAAG